MNTLGSSRLLESWMYHVSPDSVSGNENIEPLHSFISRSSFTQSISWPKSVGVKGSSTIITSAQREK